MTGAELIVDAFGRIHESVHQAAEGLTSEQLETRLGERANTIAWLVWHLSRVQDDHLADVMGTEQVWTSQGWDTRIALPFEADATGYGQSPDEVAAVRVASAEPLLQYYDAVHQQTLQYVAGLADADFDRVVDKRWNPPVTLGVRLVSVLSDCLQHAGQAAFIRGLLPSGEPA